MRGIAGMEAKRGLVRYIKEYQNYEGARVIAERNNISNSEIKELVGDFFFNLYSMDPKKRFEMKIRRGYWKDIIAGERVE